MLFISLFSFWSLLPNISINQSFQIGNNCLCWSSAEYDSATLVSSVLIFGEGNGTPLQHSGLENTMDGGDW